MVVTDSSTSIEKMYSGSTSYSENTPDAKPVWRYWLRNMFMFLLTFAVLFLILRFVYIFFRTAALETETIIIPFSAISKSKVDLDIERRGAGIWLNLHVNKNDNYITMLKNINVSEKDLTVLRSNPLVKKYLGWLKKGEYIKILQSADDSILDLSYEISKNRRLEATRISNELFIRVTQIPIDIREQFVELKIRDSLFAEGYRKKVPDSVLIQIFEIFSWDIDFANEIQKGDEFSILYEKLYRNGLYVGPGRISIAEYTPIISNQKKLAATYFEFDSGKGYYTAEGRNLKKSFLRQPVNPALSRISSGFSLARYHPIKKIWRAHKGIDFAAGTGNHVYATSKGRIKHFGYRKDYGNFVVIRHTNNYETLYAHLQRFKKGIYKGKFVRQRETIGYVGKSGLATGPHVHYEVRLSGRHINPKILKTKKGVKLGASNKKKFFVLMRKKLKLLNDNKISHSNKGAVQG